MTDLGKISNILEIKIQREETGKICLSQQKYVDELLERFNLQSSVYANRIKMKISKEMCPQTKDEKCEMDKRFYREFMEGLIYLVNAMRQDIALAANTLSYFCANPGYEHWLIAKRVLKYLKAISHYGITYIK